MNVKGSEKFPTLHLTGFSLKKKFRGVLDFKCRESRSWCEDIKQNAFPKDQAHVIVLDVGNNTVWTSI